MEYLHFLPEELHRQMRRYLNSSSIYSLRRTTKFSRECDILPLKRLNIRNQSVRDGNIKILRYFCGSSVIPKFSCMKPLIKRDNILFFAHAVKFKWLKIDNRTLKVIARYASLRCLFAYIVLHCRTNEIDLECADGRGLNEELSDIMYIVAENLYKFDVIVQAQRSADLLFHHKNQLFKMFNLTLFQGMNVLAPIICLVSSRPTNYVLIKCLKYGAFKTFQYICETNKIEDIVTVDIRSRYRNPQVTLKIL